MAWSSGNRFQWLMTDHDVSCSIRRSGNVLFSSLKTERIARKGYCSHDEARADVFDSSSALTTHAAPLDDRLSKPYRFRNHGRSNPSESHLNRQQHNLYIEEN